LLIETTQHILQTIKKQNNTKLKKVYLVKNIIAVNRFSFSSKSKNLYLYYNFFEMLFVLNFLVETKKSTSYSSGVLNKYIKWYFTVLWCKMPQVVGWNEFWDNFEQISRLKSLSNNTHESCGYLLNHLLDLKKTLLSSNQWLMEPKILRKPEE